LAVGVVLMVAIPIYYERVAIPKAQGTARLVGEAVNDHLRVLMSQRPLEIESGEMHQVRPWFAGRLDFAPAVSFVEDHDFPLRGGAVGYFVDRKAAVFVYTRRLHTVSLFVFRAEGLHWPARGLRLMGNVQVYSGVNRGFNVLLWRAGELGYALVSDLNSAELFALGVRISGGS
jgi:anti-sigma factor RsiW